MEKRAPCSGETRPEEEGWLVSIVRRGRGGGKVLLPNPSCRQALDGEPKRICWRRA